MPELKKGDYVRINDRGHVEQCEPTDFAYGTVVAVSPTADEVTVLRLGTDSRYPPVYVGLSTHVPPPTDPDELDAWLAS